MDSEIYIKEENRGRCIGNQLEDERIVVIIKMSNKEMKREVMRNKNKRKGKSFSKII